MNIKEKNIASIAFEHLRQTLNLYFVIPEDSWQAYLQCCSFRSVAKDDIFYVLGETPLSLAFIHRGLIRAYVIDENGNEFNKNFFAEGRFPGSMTALIKDEASNIEFQALEDSLLIYINHRQYRDVLFQDEALMKFHIHYLEAHWLIEKESKEIGFLKYEAKHRYLSFLKDFDGILPRVPQYHIASFLGITPTQLSRIRKTLK